LTDLRLPGLDGIAFLKEVQQRGLPVAVIVITGDGCVSEAVEAFHLGAYDFFTKTVDVEHLRVVVALVLRERTLRDELMSLRNQLRTQYSFRNILSKNPQMHAVFELISNIA
jgi:DNA-binding NtrC family response regulator